jgi:hypothetical protein
MATNEDEQTHSLEIRQAQMEEREQRLEEYKYALETKKHQLEKNKVGVDILKHITTVLAAIFAALGYFGDQIVPIMQNRYSFNSRISDWYLMIVLLALCFEMGLIFLGVNAISPDEQSKWIEIAIAILLFLMGIAGLLLVGALLI